MRFLHFAHNTGHLINETVNEFTEGNRAWQDWISSSLPSQACLYISLFRLHSTAPMKLNAKLQARQHVFFLFFYPNVFFFAATRIQFPLEAMCATHLVQRRHIWCQMRSVTHYDFCHRTIQRLKFRSVVCPAWGPCELQLCISA